MKNRPAERSETTKEQCDADPKGEFEKLIKSRGVSFMISIFGPEYANGAFVARLHFQDRGKIHVSINAQSEFEDFGIKRVASEAQLYFITETALLDNFITELKSLNNGNRTMASLKCA